MKKVVFFFFLLFSITDQLQICRPHQGSLPQGRRVRLLLQPGLGRDAHQPGDAEAPGRAEQVGAEAAGSPAGGGGTGAAQSAPAGHPRRSKF